MDEPAADFECSLITLFPLEIGKNDGGKNRGPAPLCFCPIVEAERSAPTPKSLFEAVNALPPRGAVAVVLLQRRCN